MKNTKMFSSINFRSILFGTVIFASVLGFLFSGFGRFKMFGSEVDQNTAVVVGKQSVDMMEFSSIMTSQGYSNSLPDNQKRYLANQILNQIIDQKIIVETAQNMGFGANQTQIAAFLRSIPFFQDPSGEFSMEKLTQYLSSQQMNDIEFFQRVKNELSAKNLSQFITTPELYPTNITEAQYKLENTKFMLEYAVLAFNSNNLEAKADAELGEFLKKPENEQKLAELYATRSAQYNQKTQYNVRTILISYQDALRAQGDALQRNKLEAQKLADDTLVKIHNGASFSTLASQVNDDLNAAKNNGEIGYVDDSKIDEASYIAISKLSSSSPLSQVVETPFGFRIFKFEGKKEGFSKSFEEVKPTLAKDLLLQQLRQTEQTTFENKVREALKNPSDTTALNDLLKNERIFWKSVDMPYTVKDTFISEIGTSELFTESVFKLKNPGDVLPTIFDFSLQKRVLMKLVSIRKPETPSSTEIAALQKQEAIDFSQDFFEKLLLGLRTEYEQKKLIKINPALTQ